MAFPKLNQETLYQRLLDFGRRSHQLVRSLPKTIYNLEYGKQLTRSSGAPGAEYIEAVEASSRKEFTHKLKRCRKECKESNHWLELIKFANGGIKQVVSEADVLIAESRQLIRIFTSSVLTSEKNREISK